MGWPKEAQCEEKLPLLLFSHIIWKTTNKCFSLDWIFRNEADWNQQLHDKKIIQFVFDEHVEYESDNASDTDKSGAVSLTVVTA